MYKFPLVYCFTDTGAVLLRSCFSLGALLFPAHLSEADGRGRGYKEDSGAAQLAQGAHEGGHQRRANKGGARALQLARIGIAGLFLALPVSASLRQQYLDFRSKSLSGLLVGLWWRSVENINIKHVKSDGGIL
jgi:hypothetical protein